MHITGQSSTGKLVHREDIAPIPSCPKWKCGECSEDAPEHVRMVRLHELIIPQGIFYSPLSERVAVQDIS